jgi:hypothetical protein
MMTAIMATLQFPTIHAFQKEFCSKKCKLITIAEMEVVYAEKDLSFGLFIN